MPDNVTIGGRTFLADEILSDSQVAALVERIKMGFGADGVYTDVTSVNPLPVALGTNIIYIRDAGTYAYRSGTAAATIDVPSNGNLRRISVLAGSGGEATLTIGGGDTIHIPVSSSFDEVIPGVALGADVVIGGIVQSYYVSWVV